MNNIENFTRKITQTHSAKNGGTLLSSARNPMLVLVIRNLVKKKKSQFA